MATPDSTKQSSDGWIVSARQDVLLLIGAPWIALFLGGILSHVLLALEGTSQDILMVALITVTMGHVLAVFFRSHCNQEVFVRHRFRFTIVPVLVLMAVSLTQWGFAAAMVVIPWWDVVHQARQTFRTGRLYDERMGIEPSEGASHEKWLTLALYLGPLLAGANFMGQVRTLEVLSRIDMSLAMTVPSLIERYAGPVTILLGCAVAYAAWPTVRAFVRVTI